MFIMFKQLNEQVLKSLKPKRSGPKRGKINWLGPGQNFALVSGLDSNFSFGPWPNLLFLLQVGP